MEKKNAVNFLLYSVMGTTLDSNKNQLLDAAINRAYRDACSHVLSVPDETERKKAREAATDKIRTTIQEGLNGKTYQEWHRELCQALVNGIYSTVKTAEGRSFTYGIAQKWVNMTMKYLCVVKSIFEACGQVGVASWEILDKCEGELHIPIDSFILKEASKERIKFPKKDDGTPKSWSKYENYKEYDDLQKALKDQFNGKSPLDWEGPVWIENAGKPNGKGV